MEIRALINPEPWKAYQVNWKITVCSNKLRLIVICINRTGCLKTARFQVTHFTEKSSFFFLYLLFLFFRDCRTSKNGGLGGRVAIRIFKKRWMKARSPFTRAPDSKLRVVRIDPEIFQDLFLFRSRRYRYSVWTSSGIQNVMHKQFPHRRFLNCPTITFVVHVII